ncbi:MAG: helix-turn-helix transcriptional regulator, partial [Proteobacteria bacterium]|nr:helix-turn-helix transcriptional regulator [Pseudomonadota bacterium]
MPKRDNAYMEIQREAIARATLAVLIRKGVRETTLRNICSEAGISIGTLYIHFKTKEEAVVAACQLDSSEVDTEPLPPTWTEYLQEFSFGDLREVGSRSSKRMRLSLQFVAELSQMQQNPKGLSDIYDSVWRRYSAALQGLKQRREITLPLGLDHTVEAHLQL